MTSKNILTYCQIFLEEQSCPQIRVSETKQEEKNDLSLRGSWERQKKCLHIIAFVIILFGEKRTIYIKIYSLSSTAFFSYCAMYFTWLFVQVHSMGHISLLDSVLKISLIQLHSAIPQVIIKNQVCLFQFNHYILLFPTKFYTNSFSIHLYIFIGHLKFLRQGFL